MDGWMEGWRMGGRVTGCSRWLLLRGRWCCCVEKGVNAKRASEEGWKARSESEICSGERKRGGAWVGEAAGELCSVANCPCWQLSMTLAFLCPGRMFLSRCSLVSFVSIYYCDIADADTFIRAGPWRTCLCRCLLRGEFSAWSWCTVNDVFCGSGLISATISRK